jgi:hypothetical protein
MEIEIMFAEAIKLLLPTIGTDRIITNAWLFMPTFGTDWNITHSASPLCAAHPRAASPSSTLWRGLYL